MSVIGTLVRRYWPISHDETVCGPPWPRRATLPPVKTRSAVRAVLLVVLLLVTTVAGLAVSLNLVFAAETNCMADFSEDTIVAPASWRGRVICGRDAGALFDRTYWLILAAAVGSALYVIVRWFRRPGTRLAWGLLPLVASPAFVLLVLAIPADCTAGQWQKYGEGGCERNEERRPGISNW